MATIVIDGVRREVVVARNGNGFVVTVDGRPHEVSEMARVEDGIVFLMDRSSHSMRVSSGRGGIELSTGGRTYLQQRDAVDADRPAGAGHRGDGRLESPMPGTIIAVNVAEGDAVRAGQPLVVLESMKMHNEIASPVDGVVRKINCRLGEQVGFGHVLVEIGSEAS